MKVSTLFIKLRAGGLQCRRALACAISHRALDFFGRWWRFFEIRAACNPFRSVHDPASGGCLVAVILLVLFNESAAHL